MFQLLFKLADVELCLERQKKSEALKIYSFRFFVM